MRFYSLLIVALFIGSQPAGAQQKDIVKNRGIHSRFHRDHVGQILFTTRDISIKTLNQKDFVSSYRLTNKSNLFMNAFLANSLTNYLHRLAPGLKADSLVKVGNFQFTLYVDHHLIYRSNLLPGAPSAKILDTATIIAEPFINNGHENALWSQYFWGRFMYSGGDSVLTEGKHLLRLEIRPYVQSGGLKTGGIIAAGELNLLVYRKPKIDISRISLSPVKPYDGFAVSAEKFNVDKLKELKGNIDAAVFKKITSIAVIKNGKLLVEEYFNGSARDSLHDPRSVGKSLSSTLTGIAIAEHYLKNEEEPLKDFYDLKSFDNYSPLKNEVTIKDLLTMSAVFDGNDDDGNSPGNEDNMYPTPNWVKFALDLPVNTIRPKEKWHYFTAGVILLGDVLNKAVPGGLEKYADQKLFQPLHITHYQWQYTSQHVPNTAGGILMKTLDFAKYGQLYQNNGEWKGRQLIPETWVAKTFSKQKILPDRPNEFYGYLFWNKTYRVAGKDYETYYCAGNGGNTIFVFKDQPLVIVITATAYGAPYAHLQVDLMMQNYLLPAMLNIK